MHAGTVTHMAPELIERGDVSTKCDVYAFGIFMWECYTRLAPYKGLKPPQIVLGVVSEKLRPAFASNTPEGYRVRPCLHFYAALAASAETSLKNSTVCVWPLAETVSYTLSVLLTNYYLFLVHTNTPGQ